MYIMASDSLSDIFEDCDDVSLPTCKYVDPCDITVDSLNINNVKYKVLHFNIRGLASHFDEFKLMIEDCRTRGIIFDFILLCETFLNEHNECNYKLPGYAIEPVSRKKMQRGGVCVYIKSNIEYRVRDDLSYFNEGVYESILLELIKDNIVVGEIYRIPDTNPNIFIDNFNKVIDTVNVENKRLIIGTDQNIDLLKYDIFNPCKELLNSVFEKGVIPLHTLPTRVTNTSATLIDLIYTNCKSPYIESGILDTVCISDHYPIYSFIGQKINNVKYEFITKSSFVKRDLYPIVRNELSNVDWSCLNDMSCNEANDYFNSTLQQVISHYSTKECRIKIDRSFQEPWVTESIIKSSHKLRALYDKCKTKDSDHPCVMHYKLYRSVFHATKRKAKQNYYDSKFRQYFNDSRQTWKILRQIISKSNDKSIASSFIINGQSINDPQIIANSFNSLFASVGDTTARSIVNTNVSYKKYLTNRVINSLFMAPTDIHEINRIICNMKPKSSCGIDKISSNLLKQLNVDNVISTPLSVIFNKSIQEGVFPNAMKIAKVIPVYKAKEKNILNNYRPISLLPVVSKVLERLIFERVYDFLKHNDILAHNQYGFQKKNGQL